MWSIFWKLSIGIFAAFLVLFDVTQIGFYLAAEIVLTSWKFWAIIGAVAVLALLHGNDGHNIKTHHNLYR